MPEFTGMSQANKKLALGATAAIVGGTGLFFAFQYLANHFAQESDDEEEEEDIEQEQEEEEHSLFGWLLNTIMQKRQPKLSKDKLMTILSEIEFEWTQSKDLYQMREAKMRERGMFGPDTHTKLQEARAKELEQSENAIFKRFGVTGDEMKFCSMYYGKSDEKVRTRMEELIAHAKKVKPVVVTAEMLVEFMTAMFAPTKQLINKTLEVVNKMKAQGAATQEIMQYAQQNVGAAMQRIQMTTAKEMGINQAALMQAQQQFAHSPLLQQLTEKQNKLFTPLENAMR